MFSQEVKVGMFVLIGVVIFIFGVITLGDITLQRGYEVNILFDDIAGLPEKAPVKVCGVEIGKVKDINLVKGKARVTVLIKPKAKIHTDSRASIISTGVIGTKYLEMTLGSDGLPYLKEGDTLTGINPISFDEVMGKLISGLDDLMNVLGSLGGKKELGEALQDISENLKGITRKLNLALGEDERDTRGVFDDFRTSIRNLKQASQKINEMITENKEGLKDTIGIVRRLGPGLEKTSSALSRIVQDIEKGQGALGTLATDKKFEADLKETIRSMRIFSKMLEDAPSKWIVDSKKAKEVKEEMERQEGKEGK